MDADRFDALSRALSTGHTRRRLARLLGGLSLGSALSAATVREAAAGTRPGGAACNKNSQCKTNKCFLNSGKCSCSQTVRCKPSGDPCRTAACNTETGRCITNDACPGAGCQCAVRHTASGAQRAACYQRLLTQEAPCQTDDDCGFAGFDRCVSRNGEKVCVAVEPCSCTTTANCPDVTTSCQGSTCQPVCTAETCPGDDCHCAVRQQSDGSRAAVCYSALESAGPCVSDQSCQGSEVCVVMDNQTECASPGACAECFVLTACP